MVARPHLPVREGRRIATGETLAELGFWEDELPLPSSFLLGRDGLQLEFQAYEIAPYAMGPSRILLPWDDVADLLREPGRWRP